MLLHHPYESFAASVEAFVERAAADPDVLAIKQTLYRTGSDSPIVAALIKASQSGKQVTAVVELQARFDERANIAWARALEEAGVQVVYGLAGSRRTRKMSLVIRREGDATRRYCHVGSGNYNSVTALTYEDIGLLTADPDIGADVAEVFNLLTGSGSEVGLRRLIVSPVTTRPEVIAAIDAEAEAGPAGRVVLKTNGLTDPDVIDALYRASAAGATVDLIVRGRCGIRAGVPGLSERHQGALDRRAVPRALADLPVRGDHGRPLRIWLRLARHDGAQPRPTGRGRRPGPGPRHPAAPGGDAGRRPAPTGQLVDAGADGTWSRMAARRLRTRVQPAGSVPSAGARSPTASPAMRRRPCRRCGRRARQPARVGRSPDAEEPPERSPREARPVPPETVPWWRRLFGRSRRTP